MFHPILDEQPRAVPGWVFRAVRPWVEPADGDTCCVATHTRSVDTNHVVPDVEGRHLLLSRWRGGGRRCVSRRGG